MIAFVAAGLVVGVVLVGVFAGEWVTRHKDRIIPLGVLVAAATLLWNVYAEQRRWRAELSGELLSRSAMVNLTTLPIGDPRAPPPSSASVKLAVRNLSYRPTAIMDLRLHRKDGSALDREKYEVKPGLPIKLGPWSVETIQVELPWPSDDEAFEVVMKDMDDEWTEPVRAR